MTVPPPSKSKVRSGPKIARRITPDYLHNAALYYLERYAASSGRVRRVLTDKIRRSCRDHPDQDLNTLLALIDPEIERLTRVELIKDTTLAQQFADGYRARGVPTRMIIQKLRLKNFDQNVIEAVLSIQMGNDNGDGDDAFRAEDSIRDTEESAARRYVERRRLWPFLRDPCDDPKSLARARQKSFAALTRLGYDSDVIRAVLKAEVEDI